MRGFLLSLAAVIALLFFGVEGTRGAATASDVVPPLPAHDPCPNPKPVPAELRLPPANEIPLGEPTAIEKRMLRYLYGDDPANFPSKSKNLYPYRKLGWCVDKYVRDTGPYVHGQYYGTHPAVRIYYSPEVMRWLRNGRKGVPDDGAVIIKEQYSPPPAGRYTSLGENQLAPTDWTVMIRRSSASRDGWFWAEVYLPGMTFGGVQYPNAGFGLYCLRCHASANDAATFASLSNIKGFPGDPITFKVDDSWRTPPPWALASTAPKVVDTEHEKNKLQPTLISRHVSAPTGAPLAIRPFPPEPLDGNVSNPHAKLPPQFFTSDQCMSCHGGASGPATNPAMWLTPAPSWTPPPSPPPGPAGVNVSEYGEWRWSPMGLAGRDPIFFSQIESELAYIQSIPAQRIAGEHPQQTRDTLKQQVVDTCMRCHGVMGKRSNDIDHGGSAHFNLNWVFETPPPVVETSQIARKIDPGLHYGGLARDGISCTVCHHITQTPEEKASLAYVLVHKSTGLFTVGPPDKLNGPFRNDPIPAHELNPHLGVATQPMSESLGAKPVFSDLTKSARLCTTCHAINLPVVDSPSKIHPITPTIAHDIEQNTYVEWVNSAYQTEYKPGPHAQSCQACHMPVGVDNQRLGVHQPAIQTQIAVVQDQNYPQADHLAPIDTIFVRYREGIQSRHADPNKVDQNQFRRHELLGLNAFLLRAFQQNSAILGVRLNDYMTGSTTDLPDAIDNVVHQARTKTAKLDLSAHMDGGTLVANVGIQSLVGHRFPSGVGFRRAFVELKVTDPDGKVVWASGMTNGNGEIVDYTDGKVLPTEYFSPGPGGAQQYQPHFDEAHPITRPDQVQIYEELVKDADGKFTESFIRRDHHVKDNRLLPLGWRKDGVPGLPLPHNWLEATHPEGVNVTSDPRYADGKGRAVVSYRIRPQTALAPSRLRVEATLWYQAWEPEFRRERTHGGIAASTLRALLDNMALDGTQLENWKLKIASATVSP